MTETKQPQWQQYEKPMKPQLSIVIPVYNEAKNLETLFERLTKTLDKLDKTYEIIFTNDGSKDNSIEILKKLTSFR